MRTFSADLPPEGHGPYRLMRGFGGPLVGRFLTSLDDPRAAQQRRLRVILNAARGSRFFAAHNLDAVQTLDDLRRTLPIRTYAQMSAWFDALANGQRDALTASPPSMLLETSGTTGTPKWLPVTRPWADSVADAQKLWLLAMVRDHEAVTRGKALTIVSPAEHARAPGGLPVGSNTGRMNRAQPWWLRMRYPVPYAAFGLKPSALKIYTLLRFALQQPITSITTANPSTVLLLARCLEAWKEDLAADLVDGTLKRGPAAEMDPRTRRSFYWSLRRRRPPKDWRMGHIWPLVLINCWKGGAARYFVERIPDALGRELPIREVGVTASEGYFAIPLGDDWPGGVLWTEGHIMEFVDVLTDDVCWAWELSPGRQYRMIITTEAGLFRYDLRDIIEVVGRCGQTPVIRFVGKAGRYLNATGEKVTEEQISTALRDAAAEVGVQPVGFTVRLRFHEIPIFVLAVEGELNHALIAAFDRHLRKINLEYEAKRESGRLGMVHGEQLRDGTYTRYRAARVAAGAPEGQIKDPILAISDEEWARIARASQG
ncbi:MAG: GH3 auxin-responsive promoter family protein [Myxococcota bacterium]